VSFVPIFLAEDTHTIGPDCYSYSLTVVFISHTVIQKQSRPQKISW